MSDMNELKDIRQNVYQLYKLTHIILLYTCIHRWVYNLCNVYIARYTYIHNTDISMKTLHNVYILYLYRPYIRGWALIRCYILMHFISAADRYTRWAYYNIRMYNTCSIRNEMEKKTSKQICVDSPRINLWV